MDTHDLPGLDIAGTVARLGLDYSDLHDMLAGLPSSLNESFGEGK